MKVGWLKKLLMAGFLGRKKTPGTNNTPALYRFRHCRKNSRQKILFFEELFTL